MGAARDDGDAGTIGPAERIFAVVDSCGDCVLRDAEATVIIVANQ